MRSSTTFAYQIASKLTSPLPSVRIRSLSAIVSKWKAKLLPVDDLSYHDEFLHALLASWYDLKKQDANASDAEKSFSLELEIELCGLLQSFATRNAARRILEGRGIISIIHELSQCCTVQALNVAYQALLDSFLLSFPNGDTSSVNVDHVETIDAETIHKNLERMLSFAKSTEEKGTASSQHGEEAVLHSTGSERKEERIMIPADWPSSCQFLDENGSMELYDYMLRLQSPNPDIVRDCLWRLNVLVLEPLSPNAWLDGAPCLLTVLLSVLLDDQQDLSVPALKLVADSLRTMSRCADSLLQTSLSQVGPVLIRCLDRHLGLSFGAIERSDTGCWTEYVAEGYRLLHACHAVLEAVADLLRVRGTILSATQLQRFITTLVAMLPDVQKFAGPSGDLHLSYAASMLSVLAAIPSAQLGEVDELEAHSISSKLATLWTCITVHSVRPDIDIHYEQLRSALPRLHASISRTLALEKPLSWHSSGDADSAYNLEDVVYALPFVDDTQDALTKLLAAPTFDKDARLAFRDVLACDATPPTFLEQAYQSLRDCSSLSVSPELTAVFHTAVFNGMQNADCNVRAAATEFVILYAQLYQPSESLIRSVILTPGFIARLECCTSHEEFTRVLSLPSCDNELDADVQLSSRLWLLLLVHSEKVRKHASTILWKMAPRGAVHELCTVRLSATLSDPMFPLRSEIAASADAASPHHDGGKGLQSISHLVSLFCNDHSDHQLKVDVAKQLQFVLDSSAEHNAKQKTALLAQIRRDDRLVDECVRIVTDAGDWKEDLVFHALRLLHSLVKRTGATACAVLPILRRNLPDLIAVMSHLTFHATVSIRCAVRMLMLPLLVLCEYDTSLGSLAARVVIPETYCKSFTPATAAQRLRDSAIACNYDYPVHLLDWVHGKRVVETICGRSFDAWVSLPISSRVSDASHLCTDATCNTAMAPLSIALKRVKALMECFRAADCHDHFDVSIVSLCHLWATDAFWRTVCECLDRDDTGASTLLAGMKRVTELLPTSERDGLTCQRVCTAFAVLISRMTRVADIDKAEHKTVEWTNFVRRSQPVTTDFMVNAVAQLVHMYDTSDDTAEPAAGFVVPDALLSALLDVADAFGNTLAVSNEKYAPPGVVTALMSLCSRISVDISKSTEICWSEWRFVIYVMRVLRRLPSPSDCAFVNPDYTSARAADCVRLIRAADNVSADAPQEYRSALVRAVDGAVWPYMADLAMSWSHFGTFWYEAAFMDLLVTELASTAPTRTCIHKWRVLQAISANADSLGRCLSASPSLLSKLTEPMFDRDVSSGPSAALESVRFSILDRIVRMLSTGQLDCDSDLLAQFARSHRITELPQFSPSNDGVILLDRLRYTSSLFQLLSSLMHYRSQYGQDGLLAVCAEYEFAGAVKLLLRAVRQYVGGVPVDCTRTVSATLLKACLALAKLVECALVSADTTDADVACLQFFICKTDVIPLLVELPCILKANVPSSFLHHAVAVVSETMVLLNRVVVWVLAPSTPSMVREAFKRHLQNDCLGASLQLPLTNYVGMASHGVECRVPIFRIVSELVLSLHRCAPSELSHALSAKCSQSLGQHYVHAVNACLMVFGSSVDIPTDACCGEIVASALVMAVLPCLTAQRPSAEGIDVTTGVDRQRILTMLPPEEYAVTPVCSALSSVFTLSRDSRHRFHPYIVPVLVKNLQDVAQTVNWSAKMKSWNEKHTSTNYVSRLLQRVSRFLDSVDLWNLQCNARLLATAALYFGNDAESGLGSVHSLVFQEVLPLLVAISSDLYTLKKTSKTRSGHAEAAGQACADLIDAVNPVWSSALCIVHSCWSCHVLRRVAVTTGALASLESICTTGSSTVTPGATQEVLIPTRVREKAAQCLARLASDVAMVPHLSRAGITEAVVNTLCRTKQLVAGVPPSAKLVRSLIVLAGISTSSEGCLALLRCNKDALVALLRFVQGKIATCVQYEEARTYALWIMLRLSLAPATKTLLVSSKRDTTSAVNVLMGFLRMTNTRRCDLLMCSAIFAAVVSGETGDKVRTMLRTSNFTDDVESSLSLLEDVYHSELSSLGNDVFSDAAVETLLRAIGPEPTAELNIVSNSVVSNDDEHASSPHLDLQHHYPAMVADALRSVHRTLVASTSSVAGSTTYDGRTSRSGSVSLMR